MWAMHANVVYLCSIHVLKCRNDVNMYANAGMLKEGCVQNAGEEDFTRQGYNPRSLVVLL